MRDSPPPSIIRRLALAGLVFAAAVLVADAAMSRGFNRLLEAVVRIDVREIEFTDGAKRFTGGVGSGVLISADGLVLTNAHVVSPQAVEISVTLSSLERVSAKLVGWDHWTDLALLRIDLAAVRQRGLAFATASFGDSDQLYPGQTVYAVGTPHGLKRTVTRGIISNQDRYFEAEHEANGYETGVFNTWLQTDAAINPGNSGGPLVTEDGKVIGINARAYIGAENLGFAIPANVARKVADTLVGEGRITRSYIGIVPGVLQDLERFYALASNTGMLINRIDPGSPAAKAGLRAGDVLLTLNGRKVDGRFPEQLPPIQQTIANLPVGSPVALEIKRGAQTLAFTVATEKLESRVGEEWAFEKWGLSVRRVTRAFARENQLTDESGVIVLGVRPGYPAGEAGLARGDIITKVGAEPITALDSLKKIYEAYEAKPAPQLIEARRNRRISLYVIKP
ncbi:MAG: trypsin-like peptidase domain-containing protein [Opitutae bacterium]